MKELQAEVLRSLMPLGYEPDRKPFHPHLTLARIKSMRGAKGLMDVVESHKDALGGFCPVERVVLFKSDLRPGGAVYTALHSWGLMEK